MDTGRRLAAGRGDPGRAAGGATRRSTPTPRAGHLSASLDAETTRLLLGEVPAAFHAGVQDILLIAFGLAWREFLGTGGAPIGIDVEGHGRDEELAADVDLSRTVGLVHHQVPGGADRSASCPGRRWSPATPRWARSSRTPRNNCAPCPTV